MAVKQRRKTIDKLEQAINHYEAAAQILITYLQPYMDRFPDVDSVLTPCLVSTQNIINGVKAVKEII